MTTTVPNTRKIQHHADRTRPTGTFQRLQQNWAAHRVEMAAQRKLERELASYDTPAARQELDAIVARAAERSDQAALAHIISIIDRQRSAQI